MTDPAARDLVRLAMADARLAWASPGVADNYRWQAEYAAQPLPTFGHDGGIVPAPPRCRDTAILAAIARERCKGYRWRIVHTLGSDPQLVLLGRA